MANKVYPKAREKFLSAAINMSSDTIKVALIDVADYVYDDAHEFLSSASAGIVGTPQTLGTKTLTGGVFDADNATFPTVTGDQCEALLIYKDTGSAATSPLIAYLDTGITGIPVSPNGGNIPVTWNASGIFALGS